MVRLLFSIFLMCLSVGCYAQNTLRIHHRNGMFTDIPISEVDSLVFVDTEANTSDKVTLTGSWLWGSSEAGYYELLTFNDDHTYIGYDNYFTYGFDTMTYGWYAHYGAMLTLQSNGYGYQHRYNWFITALTGNALQVMTKMGPYTYYRLQPEIIRLHVGESLSCSTDEAIEFADGVHVRTIDNYLQGIEAGTTYILKKLLPANVILAYKVIVE